MKWNENIKIIVSTEKVRFSLNQTDKWIKFWKKKCLFKLFKGMFLLIFQNIYQPWKIRNRMEKLKKRKKKWLIEETGKREGKSLLSFLNKKIFE